MGKAPVGLGLTTPPDDTRAAWRIPIVKMKSIDEIFLMIVLDIQGKGQNIFVLYMVASVTPGIRPYALEPGFRESLQHQRH